MDLPRFALKSLAAASSQAAGAMTRAAGALTKAALRECADQPCTEAPDESAADTDTCEQGGADTSAHEQRATDVSAYEQGGAPPVKPPATEKPPTQVPVQAQAISQMPSTMDLPLGMVLPVCPDNQRYSFTRPSSGYSSLRDGRLFAWDISNGYKTLLEMEFRSYHLSPLEKQVARCILSNDTNHAIGEKLLMSESTVKYHVRNIYRKTASNGRSSFAHMIYDGIESSTHSWRSRRDLELEMETLQIS